ncbi:hypothetical protein [Paludibacterium paludis]|uniref:Uncharacterized protein n=1 Tax=Paludibacterium paludis TaxID=1225769 RepID=A0A918NZ86_9NEIS|nr:hypothetical protein [Paludibacterium paludis]GGY06464.1 hypothetical protein GCM10011289_06230 [Paludibacterium paludis]
MFRKLKDKGTSKALALWLEGRLARYGELVDLDIDSRERRASLVLRPLGEAGEVVFTVTRYEIRRDDSECRLVVCAVDSTRPWLANLAEDWLVGREFAIPPLAALAL